MTSEETLTMLGLQRTICRQALAIAALNTEIAQRDLNDIEPRMAALQQAMTEEAAKQAQQEAHHGQ